MPSFYAQAGQFWLDGQPQFVQAGEFHYFRTPADQWPHRLGLLQAAGFNAVATYIPWLWHQIDEGITDLDGRSHPQRNLAGFLDLAADMGLHIIARPGPYIMAETINEGVPPWVFRRYPQAAFISQGGAVLNIASYLHPDFLACAARWYDAVFGVLTPRQITRSGRIIMIQLDNEIGMLHWVRNLLDANPHTLARFAAYLRDTYGERLAGRYPVADLEAALRDGILNPGGPLAGPLVTDYRRFYRGYLREYAAWLLAAARARGLEVPPILNIHGFANGGKTFPIGLSQLIEAMELDGMITATDVYPGGISEGTYHQLLLVNEITRALQNKAQALFSVEFQAGGNQDFGAGQASLADLHSRLCIASGMRAINHYLFFDGENDPILSPVKRHDWGHPVRKDGSLRRHYARYPKLSRVLQTYGPDLVRARPQTVTTIGFLLDYFMTEVNQPATQPLTNILTHQREVILFDMLARGLALTHRPFDALELARGELDVQRTPLCWVLLEQLCPAAVQQKLVGYVRRGGKLVIAGRLPRTDFDGAACTLLADALAVTAIQSDEPFTPRTVQVFHHRDVPASFVETYTGDFDEVFATREDGAIVGFTKRLGQGQVMVFGAAVPANTLDDLDIVHQLALRQGCPPLFELSDWADVRVSRGDAGGFLFINNYQDDPVTTTVRAGGRDLLGGQAVTVPARRGLILPIDWRLNDDVVIHYATAEICGVSVTDAALTLKTEPADFCAELTVRGYASAQATVVRQAGDAQRLRVQSDQGALVLSRIQAGPVNPLGPQTLPDDT